MKALTWAEMDAMSKTQLIERIRLLELELARPQNCKWSDVTEMECKWDEDKDCEYFSTECGEAYCLIDGTIKENKLLYCPFCGKKIKEL